MLSPSNDSAGGLFSSTRDITSLFFQIFLSKSEILSSITIERWLRGLFTNPDLSEVGMPWEISLQELDSGRNVKLFAKEGRLGPFGTYMTVNRALGFSVSLFLSSNN
jgi:hypothetical protein